jgi:hypothetical protein
MRKMNKAARLSVIIVVFMQGLHGCTRQQPEYGRENLIALPPGTKRQVWAVAPVLNLSGQREVDAFLQADLLFQQLQQVRGITAIPVNRVAEVYASLRIDQVDSPEQAQIVCELLGCDALLVGTVTVYDPYNPPKFGGSLQLFTAVDSAMQAGVDPRELMRMAAPPEDAPMLQVKQAEVRQTVGMFDAANGSVRDDVLFYAEGRNDPMGPMGSKEYLASMDRYCGFAYHTLIDRLISTPLR